MVEETQPGIVLQEEKYISFLGVLLPILHQTDRHDITEILLKVALNTITLNLIPKSSS
jgi:hypothetical protein